MSAARRLRAPSRTSRGPMPRLRVDSQWFKERIARAGYTLVETAGILRMDPSALSRALNGERALRLEEAVDLAGVLGCQIEDIVVAMGIPLRRSLRLRKA